MPVYHFFVISFVKDLVESLEMRLNLLFIIKNLIETSSYAPFCVNPLKLHVAGIFLLSLLSFCNNQCITGTNQCIIGRSIAKTNK